MQAENRSRAGNFPAGKMAPLTELIETKVEAGGKTVTGPKKHATPTNAVNLFEVLQKSLDQKSSAKGRKTNKAGTVRKTRKAA